VLSAEVVLLLLGHSEGMDAPRLFLATELLLNLLSLLGEWNCGLSISDFSVAPNPVSYSKVHHAYSLTEVSGVKPSCNQA
jgi:hypothetical protein